MEASDEIKKYFLGLENGVKRCYEFASKVKALGYDPSTKVTTMLARNLSERVEGIISVVAPQVKNSGIAERITELEEIYGAQDWRVAMLIALETAQEKFCKFKDKKEAMETGIRIGFSYVTVGVVSSPIEGFIGLEVRKTREGKDYFAPQFAGPIRSAGGTAASVSVLIIDYVRKHLGYAAYDPTDIEIERVEAEVHFFHERVTNLQYLPSEKELRFLAKNLPVQIDGDPSEKIETPRCKDLDRVPANKLRNGFCLVMAECLSLKAEKVWKKLSSWMDEMGMGHWSFLEEFVKIKKEVHAQSGTGKTDNTGKIRIPPDYTYIKEIVAGRPVLGYPLEHGSFRLRLGRARTSGLSSDSLHPATLAVLNDYIAIGTQLKTERPGKSTTVTTCDRLEGPVVKLKNGSVLYLDDFKNALDVRNEIDEIIYLGDILVNYGDMFNRAHTLIPLGYNEEWWVLEFEKVFSTNEKNVYKKIISNPYNISFDDAYEISKSYGVPMHPRFTFHYNSVNVKDFLSFIEWFSNSVVQSNKIIFPLVADIKKEIDNADPKRVLELMGVPHKVATNEFVVVEGDNALALKTALGCYSKEFDYKIFLDKFDQSKSVLENVNRISEVRIRDKSGYFIGTRMGRPEKAKMRKMIGTPHILFPVGEEGGRLRCFSDALNSGKVTAEFACYFCEKCNKEVIYSRCYSCDSLTKPLYKCKECDMTDGVCGHEKITGYKKIELPVNEVFSAALTKLEFMNYPELIKGVRGTSNKQHHAERLEKGILRAKHRIYVNRDGTTRYDMIELGITHFKPKEIETSLLKLKELGYVKDIYGVSLENENQILELKMQDVILPSCPDSIEEGADEVLLRVANFIDESLEKLYGVGKFYDLKNKKDLVGHYVVALAPHIAAGTACRIIGFSRTQGFFAHPVLHCALRRDCFSYETYLPIYDGVMWRNMKIGYFVENVIKPKNVVDYFGTLSKKVNNYYTFGLDSKGNSSIVKINNFTKHKPSKILKLKLSDGRILRVTEGHRFFVCGMPGKICASDLSVGDELAVPLENDFVPKDMDFLELHKSFVSKKNIAVMVGSFIKSAVGKFSGATELYKKFNLINNFQLSLFMVLFPSINLSYKCKNGIKEDNTILFNKLPLNVDVLWMFGIYTATGYSRKKASMKRVYQVGFSVSEKEIRYKLKKIMNKFFGLSPSFVNRKHIIYSSKVFYELFTNILNAGHNLHNKRIPELILNLSLEKLSWFLSGYYDGQGIVSKTYSGVVCSSVSEDLLHDLEFSLRRFGIFTSKSKSEKKSYFKKVNNVSWPLITKLIIPSNYVKIFYDKISFSLKRKQKILEYLLNNVKFTSSEIKSGFVHSKVKEITEDGFESTYCLDVENHAVFANGILTGQCDGDEAAIMLLMDVFLNFDKAFLPNQRGATQDEPLVLSYNVIPAEVDDMVFDMDTVWKYPLELYEACEQYKKPWDVKIEMFKDRLGKYSQFEGVGFTHDTDNVNTGVLCSSYKKIPTMMDKVKGQMKIAEILRAVNENDVARLIIEKHFMRDIKGNLRKFSQQTFRCVKCNEIYRRPSLRGICSKCSGKLVFTVSEGSIVKYLEPSISLADNYNLPSYLKQTLILVKQRIEDVFGKDKDKQEGLGQWF